MTMQASAMGQPLVRLDGRAKVTGSAPYAYEHPVASPAYLHALLATVARGAVTSIDAAEAEALDGVLLVLTHRNGPPLADTTDGELAILQSGEVAFRGQIIGGVVAETPEIARHAASLVRVTYDVADHDTEVRWDHPDLYEPEQANPASGANSDEGDLEAAMQAAAVSLDQTYTTPMEHNNPLEPHTTVAVWDESAQVRLTLYDSTQGVHQVRTTLAKIFGLEEDQLRVISPHVGGGFGSKGLPHAHNVLAAIAARLVPGRSVKLALTRQQMFTLAGHRTPTIQRVRLASGPDGHLLATAHDVVQHASKVKDFVEQATRGTAKMYTSVNRRTSQRLAPLDVPVESWMRAPGYAPGSFGLEVAMDELADACGLDPIELRRLNEPEVDPETGNPWADRRLLECLDEGARLFGWAGRGAAGGRRDGEWLVGSGVASSAYPYMAPTGSAATVSFDGVSYAVRIGAADIGTGTWTVLTQVAADALECPVESVRMEIGDTDLPQATVAGDSAGLSAWGSTVVAAARAFRDEHGDAPRPGVEARAETPENPDTEKFTVYSFGAQFVEVRVHQDTGEVRVPRMLGVFSTGRIINPRTARSQLVGGMTMGLSMALHEQTVIDHRLGHLVTHDLADYHIAAHADVVDLEATWLDGVDAHASSMGSRGLGEIGITGAAAAVANGAAHATGIRVRDLPLTPEKFLQ
jgi:xanthine dehydrogenase YagR molybdenum-binding subunit